MHHGGDCHQCFHLWPNTYKTIINSLRCIFRGKKPSQLENVSMVKHRFLLFLFCVVVEWISLIFICLYLWSMQSLWDSTAPCALQVLYFPSNPKLNVFFCFFPLFHPSTQPSARPSILWTGQPSGATLSPSWRSSGTTTCRRRYTAFRSPAPSGTPTNRSRDSCGWSTRTLAKVGHTLPRSQGISEEFSL